MVRDFTGKTAIVTGAGSGINLEFARILLKNGANVIFADLALRPEAADLIATYQSKSLPQAHFQKTDVTDWTQLSSLFSVAQDLYGGVDIVCPGAGVYEPPFSSFWHPPGSARSKDDVSGGRYAILDINLTHAIRLTQLAVSNFLSPASSSLPASPSNPKFVVHISSIAGQVTPLVAPIYNATKHAINGFVRSLGPLDKKVGIRVTAVAPGVVKTPLWSEDKEKLRAVGEDDVWVMPEEVADVMVALVSEDEIDDTFGGQNKSSGGTTTKIPIKGGTILEVSAGRVRDVQAFNDPGPIGRAGNTASNMSTLHDEVFELIGMRGWGQC